MGEFGMFTAGGDEIVTRLVRARAETLEMLREEGAVITAEYLTRLTEEIAANVQRAGEGRVFDLYEHLGGGTQVGTAEAQDPAVRDAIYGALRNAARLVRIGRGTDGGWYVTADGVVLQTFGTKDEAMGFARELGEV
jgi:hypothetical protein